MRAPPEQDTTITGCRRSIAISMARVIFSPTTTPMLPPMNEYSIAAMTSGRPSSRPVATITASFRPVPAIVISCSGGARMMEGALSLMQMAKVSAALARLDRARLPFISILTDPTTGGVTASFAMLGDLNIAEPKALIGFAGPRVIEQTIRQQLPAGFQRSEFLLEHGMVDMVVPRKDLKSTLERTLRWFERGREPARRTGAVLEDDELPQTD